MLHTLVATRGGCALPKSAAHIVRIHRTESAEDLIVDMKNLDMGTGRCLSKVEYWLLILCYTILMANECN